MYDKIFKKFFEKTDGKSFLILFPCMHILKHFKPRVKNHQKSFKVFPKVPVKYEKINVINVFNF